VFVCGNRSKNKESFKILLSLNRDLKSNRLFLKLHPTKVIKDILSSFFDTVYCASSTNTTTALKFLSKSVHKFLSHLAGKKDVPNEVLAVFFLSMTSCHKHVVFQ